MNKTDQTENNDQAEDLKQMVTQINKQESNDLTEQEQSGKPKIDVLNLPPRKEVHQNTNKTFHISITRPLLRFVFVVLLFITLFILIFFVEGIDYLDLLNIS